MEETTKEGQDFTSIKISRRLQEVGFDQNSTSILWAADGNSNYFPIDRLDQLQSGETIVCAAYSSDDLKPILELPITYDGQTYFFSEGSNPEFETGYFTKDGSNLTKYSKGGLADNLALVVLELHARGIIDSEDIKSGRNMSN